MWPNLTLHHKISHKVAVAGLVFVIRSKSTEYPEQFSCAYFQNPTIRSGIVAFWTVSVKWCFKMFFSKTKVWRCVHYKLTTECAANKDITAPSSLVRHQKGWNLVTSNPVALSSRFSNHTKLLGSEKCNKTPPHLSTRVKMRVVQEAIHDVNQSVRLGESWAWPHQSFYAW